MPQRPFPISRLLVVALFLAACADAPRGPTASNPHPGNPGQDQTPSVCKKIETKRDNGSVEIRRIYSDRGRGETITTAVHGPDGRLWSFTDAIGRIRQYTYDEKGRVIRLTGVALDWPDQAKQLDDPQAVHVLDITYDDHGGFKAIARDGELIDLTKQRLPIWRGIFLIIEATPKEPEKVLIADPEDDTPAVVTLSRHRDYSL